MFDPSHGVDTAHELIRIRIRGSEGPARTNLQQFRYTSGLLQHSIAPAGAFPAGVNRGGSSEWGPRPEEVLTEGGWDGRSDKQRRRIVRLRHRRKTLRPYAGDMVISRFSNSLGGG